VGPVTRHDWIAALQAVLIGIPIVLVLATALHYPGRRR